MADAIWFYARGGQQQGPTDLQTLREMIASTGSCSRPSWCGATACRTGCRRDRCRSWRTRSRPPPQRASRLPREGLPPRRAPCRRLSAPSAGYPMPQAPQAAAVRASAGNYGEYNPAGRSYAGDAQTAMIISIIGIFCVGIILGPIGIVLGNTARRNMRASGNMEGEGMAIAAIVIGWCIVGLAAADVPAVRLPVRRGSHGVRPDRRSLVRRPTCHPVGNPLYFPPFRYRRQHHGPRPQARRDRPGDHQQDHQARRRA